ncbi:MAG: enoyl-CoA hydratase/isomerase family protein [Rhizobiaceae bacterium]
MSYETITAGIQDAVCSVVLNRPKVLNAMNRQCILECADAIRTAEDDPSVRVVVLRGAGERAFTAGADINELRTFGPAEVLRYNRDWLNLFRRIEFCRKPVVASVRGWATGGGTELSLACDFVVASETAKFGLAEINIGVIPGAGAAVRLTRWVGRLRAKELLMLGRTISGQEALAWQLANRCVPDTNLEAETHDLCRILASKAPLALGAAKACVNIGAEASSDVALEYELREFAHLFTSRDQKEGMTAFLEKRAPNFEGH